ACKGDVLVTARELDSLRAAEGILQDPSKLTINLPECYLLLCQPQLPIPKVHHALGQIARQVRHLPSGESPVPPRLLIDVCDRSRKVSEVFSGIAHRAGLQPDHQIMEAQHVTERQRRAA